MSRGIMNVGMSMDVGVGDILGVWVLIYECLEDPVPGCEKLSCLPKILSSLDLIHFVSDNEITVPYGRIGQTISEMVRAYISLVES